jgi:hypothetical protein
MNAAVEGLVAPGGKLARSSSASSVGHASLSQRYSSPLATGVPTDHTRGPRRLPPASALDTRE